MFKGVSVSGHTRQNPSTKSTSVQISPEGSNERIGVGERIKVPDD